MLLMLPGALLVHGGGVVRATKSAHSNHDRATTRALLLSVTRERPLGWGEERSRACPDARVSRRCSGGVPGDALTAGLAGAACSAIPSTVWSLVQGDDVLGGGRAAGAIVLPHERRTAVLLAAAVPVHLAISIGWAAVMATALPRGREPVWGVVGGMAIAAVDLALIGRRIPSIAALPQGRQWADHAAYGLSVGLVLRARHAGRRPPAAGRRRNGRDRDRILPRRRGRRRAEYVRGPRYLLHGVGL